ncbi:MAG: hypothetical protein NWQ54_17155 [Paraglaciecola sp.]|uniref:hypothetical protein n=1 Tax=Paraglaciecola sp. TaxID=1920173 RepID=UPI00273ED55D|nr:hypothetical protein [Paraglaciecola sp.]MDP5028939.1 hypothetical protein [Paraglaciecola sp.]MDP5132607.1 hypothetical protein [Paraglaciecola sp.]
MNIPKASSLFQLVYSNEETSQAVKKPYVSRASNFSIFKRLLNLSLVIIGVIICINLWLVHHKQQADWYHQQANQLGRSLTVLSAHAMAVNISEQDDNGLNLQIAALMQDPYIEGVAVYNFKGQLLQQQGSESNIVLRFRDPSSQALIFVQEIRATNNAVIGYLRTILSEKKVMQFHFDYQQQLIEQFEVLVLLAAVAGGILTRAFYTIRYRQYRRKLKEKLHSSDIL